jgi:hypothetical protein
VAPDDDYGRTGAGDEDVAVVRAIYDAFARRDVEAALAHVADDVELVAPGTAERIGQEGPYRGHEGVRRYFADVGTVWDELTLYADDIRATVGSVVVFGHIEARMGGEPFSRRVVWTWRVRDGKAVWLRAHDVGAS